MKLQIKQKIFIMISKTQEKKKELDQRGKENQTKKSNYQRKNKPKKINQIK